jgi:hypothetical protein
MIRRWALSLSPLLLFALYPSTSRAFLGDIRPWLLPLSLAGILYLQSVRISRSPGAAPRIPLVAKAGGAWRRFLDLSPKAAAFRLFWFALAAYVVLLSGAVAPSQPFTGDEPHYLLAAHSLVSDGDINLADDYAKREYGAFYAGLLKPHAREGRKGPGFLYSKHFPGVSAIALPLYALGRAAGARGAVLVAVSRLPLAALSALLASLLFLFLSDLVRRRGVALAGWALFALASPFLFFSALIYSEVPPALISLFVLRTIVLGRRTSAALLSLSGAGIGLMAWFNIKYLPLAAGVFAAAGISVLFESKRRVRDILLLALPAAVPLAALYAALQDLWGGASPVLVYRGATGAFVPLANFFRPSAAEIANHFIGLVLDQRTGIFVWGPLLVLSVPGLVRLLRRRRRPERLLLIPLAAWWSFSAAVNTWGGFCPPGRPLLPVLPLFVALAAVALNEPLGRARRAVAAVLTAATVLITLAGLANPRLLYHENLAETAGPRGIYSYFLASAKTLALDPTRIVPSLSNWQPGERRVFPLVFWLIGIGILTVVWLGGPRTRPRGPRPLAAHAAAALAISLAALAFVFLRADLDERRAGDVPGGRVYLQGESDHGFDQDGFWTKGSEAVTAVLRTAAPARRITVQVASLVPGDVEIAIGSERRLIRLEERTGMSGVLEADAPVGIRWKRGAYFYAVRVRAERSFIPVRLDPAVPDGRPLGAFARIRAESP